MENIPAQALKNNPWLQHSTLNKPPVLAGNIWVAQQKSFQISQEFWATSSCAV